MIVAHRTVCYTTLLCHDYRVTITTLLLPRCRRYYSPGALAGDLVLQRAGRHVHHVEEAQGAGDVEETAVGRELEEHGLADGQVYREDHLAEVRVPQLQGPVVGTWTTTRRRSACGGESSNTPTTHEVGEDAEEEEEEEDIVVKIRFKIRWGY